MKLELDGAYLIDTFHTCDHRGGFTKFFEQNVYKNAGLCLGLNEVFVSISAKNVIRGLHFQTRNPQAKLVSAAKGKVWDVIIDLRENSPTYKKWISVELSAENHRALYIPKGFAHGFLSMEDGTVMLYQCDGKYDKETDTGIVFNDPEIGIKWPVDEGIAIHSERDLGLPTFGEYIKQPIEI